MDSVVVNMGMQMGLTLFSLFLCIYACRIAGPGYLHRLLVMYIHLQESVCLRLWPVLNYLVNYFCSKLSSQLFF